MTQEFARVARGDAPRFGVGDGVFSGLGHAVTLPLTEGRSMAVTWIRGDQPRAAAA